MKKTALRDLRSLLVIVVMCVLPKDGMSVLMSINPGSVVHTTDRGNWAWGTDLPDDVVSFWVSGTFELVIEEGSYDPFTRVHYPDTIRFTNVDIHTTNKSDRTWEFPLFRGEFMSPDFYGTQNPCFLDRTPGTCWSIGDFGWYTGSFDGETLSMSGRKKPDWFFTGANGYYYEISAQAVPVPASILLFLSGLPLLLATKIKPKRMIDRLNIRNSGGVSYIAPYG